MCDRAPCSEWEEQLGVFDCDCQQRCSWAGTPSFSNNLQGAGKLFQAVDCKSAKVPRILMEWMTEWRYQMHIATRLQYTPDLAHNEVRTVDMLQDSIAFHALKNVRREW